MLIPRSLTAFTSLARISIAKQKRDPIPIHLPLYDQSSKLIRWKLIHYLSLYECGVYVIYHPNRAVARSIYLDALKNLRIEKKITGSLIAYANVTKDADLMSIDLLGWLKSNFISPAEKSTKISNLLGQNDRIALVIDNIDIFRNHPRIESFIVGMAEESVLTKKFTVLLNISTPKFYNRILTWNGGCKIKGV